MITILRMEDEKRRQDLISGTDPCGQRLDVLCMKDREDELGWTVIGMKDRTLHVREITVPGHDLSAPDPEGYMIADSLFRSAASYGENFGADRIVFEVEPLYRMVTGLGFTEEDGVMTGPMNLIVRTEKEKSGS